MHKLALVVALTVSLLFVTACASAALSTPVAVAGQASADYPAPATSDPCDLPCRDATRWASYTPAPIQTPDPTVQAQDLAESLTSQAITPSPTPSPTSTPTPVAASQLDSLIYRGTSVYLESRSFEVVYSKLRWAVEWGDGSDPQLVYQAYPACHMRLQEGPRQYYYVGEKQLAGHIWEIASKSPPPHDTFVYMLTIEQDAFMFALFLPENGSEALRDECVSRAEAVLDTFKQVAQ